MGIKIEFEENFAKMEKFFARDQRRILLKAAKAAIRRTQRPMMRTAIDEVLKLRKMKSSELRRRWFKTKANLSGGDLAKLEAALMVSSRPVGMIHHIRGSKLPRDQKGKRINRRPKLRAMITPGKSVTLQHDFIAKGKNGKYHVFRRRTTGSTPISRQSVPGIHTFFSDPAFLARIHPIIGDRLQKEFVQAFQFFLMEGKF